jgi:hypothetical protein
MAMKILKFSAALIAASLSVLSPAQAATYLPVGPQTNISLSTVTSGGWTQCFQQSFGAAFGNSASAALSGCTGNSVLLAGRETGSGTLLVLAQALKVDALFNTGAANNGITHIANGTGWYNADRWSWGFAPAGQSVSKFECDTVSGSGRLCLHTFDFVGGYRINDTITFGSNFEKLVFTANVVTGAVPEPATWLMMIFGFGLVGGAMRYGQRHPAKVTFG